MSDDISNLTIQGNRFLALIPRPSVGGLPPRAYRCPECGAKFFTLKGYHGHFALEHIVKRSEQWPTERHAMSSEKEPVRVRSVDAEEIRALRARRVRLDYCEQVLLDGCRQVVINGCVKVRITDSNEVTVGFCELDRVANSVFPDGTRIVAPDEMPRKWQRFAE